MQEMSRKNKLFTDSVIRRMTRVSLVRRDQSGAGLPRF